MKRRACSLLFVYQDWYTSGNTDSSGSRVAGRVSEESGRTWSEAFVIKEMYVPDAYEGVENGSGVLLSSGWSPGLLALLGFKVWNAYGRIESPAVEFISPGETSLGEMRPE